MSMYYTLSVIVHCNLLLKTFVDVNIITHDSESGSSVENFYFSCDIKKVSLGKNISMFTQCGVQMIEVYNNG